MESGGKVLYVSDIESDIETSDCNRKAVKNRMTQHHGSSLISVLSLSLKRLPFFARATRFARESAITEKIRGVGRNENLRPGSSHGESSRIGYKSRLGGNNSVVHAGFLYR